MVVKGYPFQKGFDCMKKFYLAYGSNLNVKQMQQDRLLSDHRTQTGLYRSGGSLVGVGTR